MNGFHGNHPIICHEVIYTLNNNIYTYQLPWIAVLAFNNVSFEQSRGKEFTVFGLMSNNVDGILYNNKLKAYPRRRYQ